MRASSDQGTVELSVAQSLLPPGLSADDARLLAQLPVAAWPANGIPDQETAARRLAAAAAAMTHLTQYLLPPGLRESPLGPAWSTDLDVHVRALPPEEQLLRLGWLPLDELLTRVGEGAGGRWAIVADGRVLGALDLHVGGAAPNPMEAVLRRCRRRGEVRLREVLEFRALRRSGFELPDDVAIRVAAGIEQQLGGNELAAWFDGSTLPSPARVPGLAATTRRTLRRVPRRRKRRLVVGVSGVDGSGKTTLTRELLDALTIAGVPAGRVWARPGLGLDGLNRLVGMVKRLLGQDAGFAVKQVAAASSPSQARPPSRRGLIGRIWTLIVTLAFLRDSRRQHRRARGVVVHERQQLDALVTLDLAYDPNFALPHVLVRWLEPRSQYAFFLDLAPEVAVRRKPDDIFGEAAVRRQVALYESYLAEDIEVHVLDGKRPVAENVIEVLQVLTGGLPLPHLDGVDPHSP